MNGSNKSICIIILKLIFLSLTLDTFSMLKVAINLHVIHFDFKDTQNKENNPKNVETTENDLFILHTPIPTRYTHTHTYSHN